MEKKDFRENYGMLAERFPGRAALTPKEVAELLDADVDTVYAAIKRKYNPLPHQKLSQRKLIIPMVGFARWLCGK